MRETILAVLALGIATTMSLGIISASLQSSIKQIDREIEVYGSAVATHVMDYIGSRSFDERTTPNSWKTAGSMTADDSTEFSLVSTFGSSPQCNLFEPYNDVIPCDDIDDTHMADTLWQPYDYVVKDTLTIPFEVNAQVFYVNTAYPDSTLGSTVKTNTKKIVVTVRSVQHQLDNLHGGVVTLERYITFDEDAAINRSNASVPVCSSGTTIYVNNLLVPIYESQGATSGEC